MTKHLTGLTLAVAVALSAGGATHAQQPTVAGPAPASPTKEGALLKVQVVISRYQGEKKISSQPYSLSVTANGPRGTLRMGTQVAVPTGPLPSGPDGKAAPVISYNYKDVGTSIDCTARALDDGRYRLELSISDNSVAADDQGSQTFMKGVPQFRNFQIAGETAVLRDGQSAQLTTATEKVTGETVKVDLTLTVAK